METKKFIITLEKKEGKKEFLCDAEWIYGIIMSGITPNLVLSWDGAWHIQDDQAPSGRGWIYFKKDKEFEILEDEIEGYSSIEIKEY